MKGRIKLQSTMKKLSIVLLTLTMVLSLIQINGFTSVHASQSVTANISFESQIVSGVGSSQTLESVQSGEPFFLAIRYTVNSGGDNVRYNECGITIQLPKYVKFDELAIGDQGNSIFDSAKVEDKFGDGTEFVYLTSSGTLTSGTAGTIYLKLHFENLKTPDGTTALFNNMIMTGNQLVGSESTPITDIRIPSATIISTAHQEWEVLKSVVKQEGQNVSVIEENGIKYYKVNYQVLVRPGNESTSGNRYGRLDCEKFSLTDTLPTGYPTGGGAKQVSIMIGNRQLSENSDYTLNYNTDGSIETIQFNESSLTKYQLSSTDTNFIPEGTPINTTYTVSVLYPYEAYEIPANQPFLQTILDNQAVLQYKPLQKSEQTLKSNATVQVGWQEENPAHYNITVTKKIRVGAEGTPSINVAEVNTMTKEYQDIYYVHNASHVTFRLYSDSDCQTPALDYNGTPINSMEINADGLSIFEGLIAGTYYLKEDTAPSYFDQQAVRKIVLAKDGTMSVDDVAMPDRNIEVVNTSTQYGYVAFWKRGSNATQADTGWLKGVSFTLENRNNPSLVYEATSNESGLVLFSGIPAGSYTIKEKNDDAEFVENLSTWDVEVVANQVNYPETMDKFDGQYPYVLNVSNKGKFKIIKKDSQNKALLSGAEFKIYQLANPSQPLTKEELENFNPDPTQTPIDLKESTVKGEYESIALEEGYYVVQETKAPLHYVLDNHYFLVYVTKNHLEELIVTNDQQGRLMVRKFGVLSSSVQFSVPINGAEFTVYQDEQLTKQVLDAEGNPIIITPKTDISDSQGSSSNIVYLDPGNYYLKEIKTPDGYQPITNAIPVSIVGGQLTTENVNNQAETLGQLKIIKKDSKTENPLAKAEFRIIRKSDKQIMGTLTTNSKGEAISGFLAEGTYELLEVVAPKGYVLNETPVEFNITKNTLTTLESEIKNDPYVNYQIKKIDSVTKGVIEGAEFRLYESNTDLTHYIPATTGKNGIATFSNLVPGKTYYYQEVEVPKDYVLDDTLRSFVAPQVNETDDHLLPKSEPSVVENEPKGMFFLEKQRMSYQEGTTVGKLEPLSISFHYYPKLTDSSEQDKETAKNNETYLSITTNQNGMATSSLLKAGSYWVEEENPYDLYEDLGVQTVQIVAGVTTKQESNTLKLVNQYAKGRFKLKKVDSTTQQPVNATFDLYRYKDGVDISQVTKANITDPSIAEKVIQFDTSSNGLYESNGLRPAQYALVETNVKGSYVLSDTVYNFTIEKGVINLDYFNNPIQNAPTGSLSLVKDEVWGSGSNQVTLPAYGFNFNVYQAKLADASTPGAIAYNGQYYVKDGTLIGTLTSGKKDALSGMNPGFYYVEETLTEAQAKDYEQQSPQIVELLAGQTASVTFHNISNKTRIKVEKVDAADSNKKLNNAKFDIYQLAENQDFNQVGENEAIIVVEGQQYKVVSSGLSYQIVSGTAVLVNADGKIVNGSTEKGIGYSGLLEVNTTYFLREVQAPDGYKASSEWTKVQTGSAGTLSEVTITNFKPISPTGDKVDAQGQKVSGAILALLDNEEKAYTLAGATDAELDALINDPLQQQLFGILAVSETKNGVIDFGEVDASKMYYIVELKAPDNYIRDTSVHKVEVKKENDGSYHYYENNQILKVINNKYQRIWIKKMLQFAGDETALNGVNFNIYRIYGEVTAQTEGAIKGNDEKYYEVELISTVQTGTQGTSGEGIAITEQLDPGNYLVVEDYTSLPANTGIVIPNEVIGYKVTLSHVTSDGKDNLELFEKPIVNTTEYGKFVLTKVANLNKDLKLQATFKLYVQDTNNQYVEYNDENGKTLTIDTNKAIYQSPILLKAGKYRLVEQSVENGYTVAVDNSFDFEIQANKITGSTYDDNTQEYQPAYYEKLQDALANPITIVNMEQGRLELKKYGKQLVDLTVEEVPIEGAEFDVYRYQLDNGTLLLNEQTKVGTAKSLANGTLEFYRLNGTKINASENWLDAGDYVLKETKVTDSSIKNGYIADYLGKVTIASNQATTKITPITIDGKASLIETDKIMNESQYGQFQITKVDSSDSTKTLKDVRFEIFTKTANEQYQSLQLFMTTNEQGIATSPLLPSGEYYLKETNTPNGYFSDDTYHGPYQVEKQTVSKAVDNKIENVKKQSIKVIKKDTKTTNAIDSKYMDGTKFGLYLNNDLVAESTYQANTGIYFGDLLPNTTYELQELQAPNGYVLSSKRISVTTNKDGSTKEIEVLNDPYGSLKIEKVASWGNSSQKLPLEGAEFTLTKEENGEIVGVEKSNQNGEVLFLNLEAGEYILKETKTVDGFEGDSTEYPITIVMGEENSTLTGEKAVVNYPKTGKFEFKKVKPNGDALEGAKFSLYRIEGDNETLISDSIITKQDGTFSSYMLDPGTYKLVETSAPDGFEKIQDIPFKITAKEITTLKTEEKQRVPVVVDQALGQIEIIKKDDVHNYISTLENQVISGVHFGLYTNNGDLVEEKVTDQNGKIVWTEVKAGGYYVQEIDHEENPEGYEYSDTQYQVTVNKDESEVKTYYPIGTTQGEIINTSNKGRLVIKKTDPDNPDAKLSGAIFEIYSDASFTTKVDEITIGDDGYGISSLLSAEANGTTYYVKEVQAPDGYVLDDTVNSIKQEVMVYPIHQVEAIKTGNKNLVTFKNTSKDTLMDFKVGIHKGITENDLKTITASESLSLHPYENVFIIRNFANGNNKVKAESIEVSDTQTELQYYDASQGMYMKDSHVDQDSYFIHSVSIYRAYHKDNNTSAVKAKVYYQTYGSDVWVELPYGEFDHIEALNQGQSRTVTIDPSLKAAHVKVVYTGVDKGFISDGFDLHYTFNQRPSDETYNEIRRIQNVADIQYNFIVKDELGTDRTESVKRQSEVVEILFPALETKVPTVSLGVVASNPNGNTTTFKPGETVQYTITAQNVSTNGANFNEPVISFDLPVGMTLNSALDNVIDKPFKIIKMSNSAGAGADIDMKDIEIIYSTVEEARVPGTSGLENLSEPTTKITFRFKKLDAANLLPGESLKITFAGTISYSQPSSQERPLWVLAYLNSDAKIVKSVENPYGNSFSVNIPDQSSNPLVEDEILDKALGEDVVGGNKHANANADIQVNDNNTLYIYKQVKGDFDDDYMDYNRIAQTSSGGSIDYRINVKNGEDSDMPVDRLRIVDILPFYGDTLTSRDNDGGAVFDRTTSLEKEAILKSVDLFDLPENATAKIYYCIDSRNLDTKWDLWTKEAREKVTREEDLPILYKTMKDEEWQNGVHKWYSSDAVTSDDLKYVSAIAVEISCENGHYFEKGQSLSIGIQMVAPTYGTDELDEFNDKYIANSAMVAVSRAGMRDVTVASNNRTENHEVKIKLSMPKGTIGDYAFYDINRNGLQDDSDAPIAGLGVKLYQYKTTSVNGQTKTERQLIKTTTTSSSGYYEFDALDCNVPMNGASKDSTDPNDFASGVIYSYQVEFEKPKDESRYQYVPTLANVGTDDLIDSDIGNDPNDLDTYLLTPTVRLTATKEGNNYIGEINNSLDAGFTALGALGNYVWIDTNRNGIQDEDENGINGVIVRVYQANKDGTLGTLLDETKTTFTYGKEGYYSFDNLPEGDYIVEFDTSEVVAGGYSQHYQFTTPYQGDSEYDSNAVHFVSASIMRSDVIKLDYRGYDMSIDAGLTVYSALSGIAFEDRNYNDVQDLDNGNDVPVPNTLVELYRINSVDGVRESSPMATQVVKEDGKYYFDHLADGQYQVRFVFPDEYEIVRGNIGDDTKDSDIEYDLNSALTSGFTDIITIPNNTLVEHVDGGASRFSSLGDYVWFDANQNGLQDTNKEEYGIANVPVYLQMRSPDTVGWEQVAQAVTDQSGHYKFEHLKSSDYGTEIVYRIVFDLPINSKLTIPKNGDVELDSNALATYLPGAGFPTDLIHLNYYTQDLSWDAGIINSYGAIGDYVWFDENQNGLQDEINSGIGGIPVILEYNETGDLSDDRYWQVIGQTVTNQAGYYLFTELNPGMYRVRFQIESPYYVTLSNIGNDAASDSDGVLLYEKNWYYSRPFYLEEDGYDMTWDCGVYLPKTFTEEFVGLFNPDTKDPTSIVIWIGIGLASVCALSGIYLQDRKKKRKSKIMK